LTSVDAWIGTGGRAVAQLIVPVLKPKVYMPSHWDGLFNSFWAGMPFPYVDSQLKTYLTANNVQLVPQFQYMTSSRSTGLVSRSFPNHDVKQKLGFSDVQTFASDILDAASKVASTAIGDDCGDGDEQPEWANSRFASNMNSAIYFGSQFAQQTPWITALERRASWNGHVRLTARARGCVRANAFRARIQGARDAITRTVAHGRECAAQVS
jgi:hypothetical protein